MKTYEEKTQSVFRKMEEAEARRRKRSRTVRRVAAPLLSLCLAAVIGFGVRQTGVFRNPPTISAPDESGVPDELGAPVPNPGVPIPNPDGTIQREEMPEEFPTHPILKPGDEGYVEPILPIRDLPDGDPADESGNPATEAADLSAPDVQMQTENEDVPAPSAAEEPSQPAAEEPVPEDVSSSFSYVDADGEFVLNVRRMIGHYDRSLNEEEVTVSSGQYMLSHSLEAALCEYGDTVRYRVVVEVFRDGTLLDSGSAEVNFEEEQLAGENYTVAHETYWDTVEKHDSFTLHAEADQLLHFSARDAYGYYISLYDEYFGWEEPAEDFPVGFSAGAFSGVDH